jgi:general nucleoside transport system permease protein
MKSLRRISLSLLPLVLSILVAAGLLLLVGASPLSAFAMLWQGAFGTPEKAADTFMVWVPLALCAAGLLVTFAAGLWNIGVEGQIAAGAIASAWMARTVTGPAVVVIPLVLLAGIAGGVLWGVALGLLRAVGRVNEIFAGLGLNFVATGLTIYLIIGPWKREGIASTSGTAPFPREAWLPAIGNSRLSPLGIALALLALVIVYFLLRDTHFGLRLRAVGKNPQSAFLLGMPGVRYTLAAFAVCGVFAGLAGAVQATGFHHKLVPTISGGYGYLAVLVTLLSGYQAIWAAPIAVFFAAITVGSTQLQLRLNLDSSLGGVLQGLLVLATLLGQGVQSRLKWGRSGPGAE